MATTDDIGGRGEAIFFVKVTDFCGRKRPFFRPHFLGEKFATFDYLVELLGAGKGAPFFFVQVKATRRGYTKRTAPPRLKIGVSERDVARMIWHPAPTYVVGIDEEKELAYIASVHGKMARGITSLPAVHLLNCRNLQRLWNEVRAFWDSRDMMRTESVFSV